MTEAKDVVVKGTDVQDPADPQYRVRTPRDVAINKTKAGEDVGLESSVPDHSPRFHVPAVHASNGTFVDGDGHTWERTKLREDRATVLSRSAILKDGGDPGLLGIEDDDRYELDAPVSNAQLSPNGVMDTETGAIREKTPEELAGATTEGDGDEKPRKTTKTTKSRRVGNGKGRHK